MRTAMAVFLVLVLSQLVSAQAPEPIIDMHLHASAADANGPPPIAVCAPFPEMPVLDPRDGWPNTFGAWMKNPPCPSPIWSPKTDAEVMEQTIAILKRRNIFAVTSGPAKLMDRWRQAGGDRIIPGLTFTFSQKPTIQPAEVRQLFLEKRYQVFAEVAIQYDGVSPSDPMFDPYLAVAEELDIPMGIHIGTGPPGAPYLGMTNYRARLHSPLVLEEALIKHPKLRLYVMHAGWPMLDDLLVILYTYPQVHLDVGVISFILPRPEFHRYLQRIVEAGFLKRVMFGSDQMNWPGAIERALEGIETAPFLTKDQKRDIFYNNAARFLRLSKDEIAKHRSVAGQRD